MTGNNEDRIRQDRDNFARGLDWLRGQADLLLEAADDVLDEVFVKADEALEALYQRALAEEGGVQEKNLTQEEVYALMVEDLSTWSEHVNGLPEGMSAYRNMTDVPFAEVVAGWNGMPGDFKSKSVHDWLHNHG